MSAKIPKIACLPNGPYYLLKDMEPVEVPNLQSSKGEPRSTVPGIALCRCGASKNKPFCDGSHGIVGFSDKKTTDGGWDRRVDYKGKAITIHDNRGVCSHAGLCVGNLPSVFGKKRDPWIDPDGATAEEIIALIESCPSGALSYSIDDVEYRDQDRDAMITIMKDGPYAVTGGIELMGQDWGEGASTEHYTLCRCGASKNKPFCDGAHAHAGFKDENN